jgi:hypothetical protein
VNLISRTAMVTTLATAATLTGIGAGTAAYASPTPPTPDYVCDDLIRLTLPQQPFTVHADNCVAQHGAPYGNFTDKIIAERRAPQAHIRCWSGMVNENGYFLAADVNCHLVWYKNPS